MPEGTESSYRPSQGDGKATSARLTLIVSNVPDLDSRDAIILCAVLLRLEDEFTFSANPNNMSTWFR